MTDPIADMLTRIRNAQASRHEHVSMPHSKIKEAIAKILTANDFVNGYKVEGEGIMKFIMIDLKEFNEAMTGLVRVSKPGRRMYTSSDDIPLVLGGRGMVILSTSHGVMSGRDARKKGLGGELICKVW